MGQIELFINSLDCSDIVASITPEGNDSFTVKLRRVGKAGRLSKQAQLLENTLRPSSVTWLEMRDNLKQTKFPIVVYCLTKAGEIFAFPDSYLTFAPGKIGIRKRNKPFSFTTNIGGGFVVPAEFRDRLMQQMAQDVGLPRVIFGAPVRIPRHLIEPVVDDAAAEAARMAWEGTAPYSVGIDAARAEADVTAFAMRFATATGRSAADVENDIQSVANLESSRAFQNGVQARIDLTLLEGDEVADDE